MGRVYLLVGVGVTLCAGCLGIDLAIAGGFALYEGSARGNALGGGLVGRADDPSALYYNPAGITGLPGVHVMSGATGIAPATDVVTMHENKQIASATDRDIWLVPHLYVTSALSDALWFGLGVFSPFGLGTGYDPGWPGRYNTYEAVVRTLAVNPNVAFKATEKLSLAFGVSWVQFDLRLRQKIDVASFLTPAPDTYETDVDQSLAGDSCGVGFNMALHYEACDWLAIGMAYRSKVKEKVKGDVDFSKPPAVQAMFPTLFGDTTVSGDVVLPDMLFVAMALRPFGRCSVEVGGIWTGWSSYDQLVIHYGKPILDPIHPHVVSMTRQEHWADAWRTHVGVEYEIFPWLDLRLSHVFDVSPVPDETANYLVPSSDRHLFSVGCGFRWGSWVLDLSYGYLDVKDRVVAARPAEGVLPSRFDGGHAHLVGLSVRHGF
jgi:long-chain fatty acid transport protein